MTANLPWVYELSWIFMLDFCQTKVSTKQVSIAHICLSTHGQAQTPAHNSPLHTCMSSFTNASSALMRKDVG
jgi:hypothetical protein